MNKSLKIAFISHGTSQVKAANEMGIDPVKLSKIIHGWICPSDQEKASIAIYLDRSIDELFEECE